MTIAYVDCFSGAAGDMLLGALVDAGYPLEELQETVARLNLPDVSVDAERVQRHGIAATKVHVRVGPGAQTRHRHLPEIERIISAADLPARVAENAVRVFRRLAEAEAQVHGTTVEKVHFHEVGAADAIVDIVGTCAGFAHLEVSTIVCSPLVTGSGTVKCAHGVMPVPAPATALLLRDTPAEAGPDSGELLTPTGAALLTTLAARFGPLPPLQLESIGYGAGTRPGETRPNLIRILRGPACEPADETADTVVVLEAQIDDQSPEALAFALDALLTAGAIDAYATPVTMKKSRAGHLLTVLARPADEHRLTDLMLTHTTTFGVRAARAQRVKLAREQVSVRTRFGDVRIKLGQRDGRIIQVAPEYEDCARVARAANVTLREVQQAAIAAWRSEHVPDR